MVGYLVILIAVFIKGSDQCSHGDVRLVNGNTLQEGRLEICINSNWSTVCDDEWDDDNARVVCRQLGYNKNVGRAIPGACFGEGFGSIALDDVRCTGEEATLLNCSHDGLFEHDCNHREDASVQCTLREDQRVKNITVSIEIINTPDTGVHTALISWTLYNTTMDKPISFNVKCSNEKHSIAMLVNATGKKSTTHLIGLLPFTSYNCCVSAEYELYVADGICDDIKTPELFVKKPFVTTNTRTALTEVPKLSNSNASESGIVGGVLGAVVVILLILLTVTLVYLLWQSNWKRNATKLHRLSVSVDRFRNSDLEEYSNYSLLGPDYEALNSRRQLQSQGKNLVSKDGRLSEQYEYSETHLTTEGGGAEESANYYEATSSLRQSVCTADDNYSYLKY